MEIHVHISNSAANRVLGLAKAIVANFKALLENPPSGWKLYNDNLNKESFPIKNTQEYLEIGYHMVLGTDRTDILHVEIGSRSKYRIVIPADTKDARIEDIISESGHDVISEYRIWDLIEVLEDLALETLLLPSE